MIVCSCKAVCDRTIRSTINAGACTVEAVARACRAGTGCGSCLEQIASMLPPAGDAELAARAGERMLGR